MLDIKMQVEELLNVEFNHVLVTIYIKMALPNGKCEKDIYLNTTIPHRHSDIWSIAYCRIL